MKTPEQIVQDISSLSSPALHLTQYFNQLRGDNEITLGSTEIDEVLSQVDTRPYLFMPTENTLAMALGVTGHLLENRRTPRSCRRIYLNFFYSSLTQLQTHLINGGTTNAEYGFRPIIQIFVDHPIDYRKTLVQPEVIVSRGMVFKPSDPLEVLASRIISDFLETNTVYYQRQQDFRKNHLNLW